MFAKKRKPWFVGALANLAVAALIYRTARWFQKLVAKNATSIDNNQRERQKKGRPRGAAL
jgi:hypothetical protein